MDEIKINDFGDFGNWVNNTWDSSSSGNTINVISPYFDKKIATVPDSSSADLDKVVNKARSAFYDWRNTNIRDRANIMSSFKSIINDFHQF